MYRARTIIVQVRPQDDDRTDAAFEEEWENERTARESLIDQVELLADLPHPPVRRAIIRSDRSGAHA